MSKHECKKLSYVSVEMAAGYQQMIGVKSKTPIWFVCIEGRYGIFLDNMQRTNYKLLHTLQQTSQLYFDPRLPHLF